jgi:hypothetical protein
MPASKIAVIETRLPYTDRRALSEAWFSALHLAHDEPTAAHPWYAAASNTVDPGNAHANARSARASAVSGRRDPARTIAQAARRSAYAGLDTPARRASDPARTAAAARAFDRARSYAPFRTSITLDGANGTRVHLIVRRVGPTLHVIALCPPAVESLVRKALASADLHFRARGERLEAGVNQTGAAL